MDEFGHTHFKCVGKLIQFDNSSYTSSNHRHSYPLPTIFNSKQISKTPLSNSDDDEENNQCLTTPSYEYSLTELFRIELIYKLYYSINDNQLLFQLIRLIPNQSLIEHYFPILICKIRLFTNNDKQKSKKYFSKQNSINEIFKFHIDQYKLKQSYLKIHVLGQHKNDKRLDLGHITLVLNQYKNLMIRVGQHHNGGLATCEQHTKFIPIYEDRIDMITQQQV